MLYRHAFAPVAVSKKKGLMPAKFWHLDATNPTIIEGSIAWSRLLPNTTLVHRYGCQRAEARNNRSKETGKFRPNNRQVYCGVYSFPAGAVRKLPGIESCSEIVGANVVYKIEEGDIAHAALVVRISPNTVNVEEIKTIIHDRLWRATGGPAKHVCDCDKDVPEHPSNFLDTAGSGLPAETQRGFVAQLARDIRFLVESGMLNALERRKYPAYQADHYLSGL